jgi:hypothetical protein
MRVIRVVILFYYIFKNSNLMEHLRLSKEQIDAVATDIEIPLLISVD